MSYILKLCFLSIFVLFTFLVADLVRAHVGDGESSKCTYQLLCEGQAIAFEKINNAMTRVAQISNQELALEMIVSLENARVLAQDRYLGKSLMTINVVERMLRRELAIVESVSPVEPVVAVISTSTVAVDPIVGTTTVDVLSVIDDVAHVDKDPIILSQ